jgi:uroporphyrinogen decarboxylase
MIRSHRLLEATHLRHSDCTPVWFMRQAGRYLPEYRRIREKHGLMEMFKTPELAAEITLQPIRILSVDAAIIFADILLPLEGMGIRVDFAPGEGPVISNSVHSKADVEALLVADPEADLSYVLKSISLVKRELEGKIPLIGFAGAPFTLASYMIEGGSSRDCLLTKRLMYEEPETWRALMEKLAATISRFLLAQARAGAQIVQLFDSWVGCLSPLDYEEFVLEPTKKIFMALKQENIPSIHFGTGTAGLLPLMRAAGGDIIGVDWRISLNEAWRLIGADSGVQGNLDPALLLAPWPILRKKAKEIVDSVGNRPGHIFNLGHGILPTTPVDSAKMLVDFVKEYTAGRRLDPAS